MFAQQCSKLDMLIQFQRSNNQLFVIPKEEQNIQNMIIKKTNSCIECLLIRDNFSKTVILSDN